MVHTDEQRIIWFPSDYNGSRFKTNVDVRFQVLEKILYNVSVAMYYLEKKYQFSLFDFKSYHLNLITKDGIINHYQKVYRDYKVTIPKQIQIEKKY